MAVTEAKLQARLREFPGLEYILWVCADDALGQGANGGVIQSIGVERLDVDALRAPLPTGKYIKTGAFAVREHCGERCIENLCIGATKPFPIERMADWISWRTGLWSDYPNTIKYLAVIKRVFQSVRGLMIENSLEVTIYRPPKTGTLAELVASAVR